MEISDNEAQTAGTVETLGCNTRDTLSEAAMGEIIEACGYHSLDDIRSVLNRYRIDVNNFTLNNVRNEWQPQAFLPINSMFYRYL